VQGRRTRGFALCDLMCNLSVYSFVKQRLHPASKQRMRRGRLRSEQAFSAGALTGWSTSTNKFGGVGKECACGLLGPVSMLKDGVEGTGLSVNTSIALRLSRSKNDRKSKGSDVSGNEEQRVASTAPNEESLVETPNMVD